MNRTSTESLSEGQGHRGTKRTRRGFTLVELMVALSAGVIVAGASYQLSQASMEVFISESRLSSAQYSATLGITRLQNDLQRAGFMSNPNLAADVGHQCGPQPPYITPAMLGAVRVDINQGTTEAGAGAEAVDVVGNFTSTELLDFRTIDATGKVHLQIDRPATQRLIDAFCAGGPSFQEIFPQNHFVRITDNKGFDQYRVITGPVAIATNATPRANCPVGTNEITDIVISLDSAPATTSSCGPNIGRGLINPVSRIRYQVGAATAANGLNNADIRAYGGAATDRSEDEVPGPVLIRQVLGADGALISAEVAAPFIVDFEVTGTVRSAAGLGAVLNRMAFNDIAIETIAPQRFVGLRAMISSRTRGPDRETPGIGPSVPGVGSGSRIDIGANPKGRRFARLRSMFVEVNLPNMGRATF